MYVLCNDESVYDKHTRNKIKSSTLLIDVAVLSFYARRQKLVDIARQNIVLNLVRNTHARIVISKKIHKSFVYSLRRTANEFISVAHLMYFSLSRTDCFQDFTVKMEWERRSLDHKCNVFDK